MDFTVQKHWDGTPGNAWPDGEQITLRLLRKTRTGDPDSSFSADYVLSASAVVSQGSILDNYGEENQTGEWDDETSTLTVRNLPKYDTNGNAWLYYVTETEIQNASGGDMSGKYSREYRDRNHYKMSGDYTYSGSSLTNVRTSITVSKTVAGNMGDKNKVFSFHLTLRNGDAGYVGDVEYRKGTETGSMTFTDGTAVLQLKDGEWITLLDLPGSLSYTVSEDEGDAAGYETTYTINGGIERSGRSAEGTLASNPAIAFVNTKEAVIPTGVFLNVPAWLCMTLLSLFLPLGLWLSRKRRL